MFLILVFYFIQPLFDPKPRSAPLCCGTLVNNHWSRWCPVYKSARLAPIDY